MSIQHVARSYATADNARAWRELLGSLIVYLAGYLIAFSNFDRPVFLVIGTLMISGAALRIYMIQHDCSHRSFFSDRKLNDRVGTLISCISMTPYEATKYIHSLHHTHVSDLSRRDTFEVFTMTLAEWHEASTLKRIGYWLYRSPLTLILIGPFIFFLLVRRFPLVAFKTGIWNLALHNALIGLVLLAIYAIAGWAGLGVWLAAFYCGSVIGALVSYVVHNFEDIHYGTKPSLDFQTAALKGSSVLDWGRLFDFVSLNIGYHDLHHLNAKIPGYKLRMAHQALEEQGLLSSHKIGFWESIACFRWKLYDEAGDKMVRFPRRDKWSFLIAAE